MSSRPIGLVFSEKRKAKAKASLMTMDKNPIGRPTDYKPEYCQQAIELGKQGKSWTQIAASFDVSRSTLYLWKDSHPEFSDALDAARSYAQAWWEDIGQTQMVAPVPGFSANLWAKQVSSRFAEDYTDKTKQEVSGGTSLEVRFVGS